MAPRALSVSPQIRLQSGGLEAIFELCPLGRLESLRFNSSNPEEVLPKDLRAVLELADAFPIVSASTEQEARFRAALEQIPLGQTRTYGELARELRTSPRAIASRCAANRLLLRYPCHRVVGKTGPGGYQLGLVWKTVLLGLEKRLASE